MDKLSFLKENFKKRSLVARLGDNGRVYGIYELLETYKESYRWIQVQRYYLNGEFSPLFTDLAITDGLFEDSIVNYYVVIKEFYYD